MKKILAIFLSVLLICAAMPFAFATAAEDATIVVSDVEGKAGETVQVTVSMKNNPGIVSTKVEVGYDASVLEFVGAEDGDFNVKGYSYSDDTRNPFIINWCWANGDNETTELLATLTFKIKDDAAAGTYPLTLTYDNEGDIYDVDFNTVIFGADEGSVTVVADAPVNPDEPTYTDPTIVVSKVEAEAGQNVSVTVSMKNNPGIVSTKVEVGYDASVLEFVGAEDGDFNVKGYSYSDDTRNPFIINWCWANGDNETTELLATLTFKIKDDAAAGTYPLTLTYDNEGDIYDVDFNTVIFGAAEGAVTVIGDEPDEPDEPCKHEYDADCDPECNLCGEIRPVHTEGIIHFDAVDAGCHYNGNIEYWYCPKCECFWQDEALTQLTNSKNVIVPALGGEVIAFEAIEPGCHYAGQIAYWFCPECEQYWQDEALTQLTNAKNVILPAKGGEVEHVAAVEPTCQSEGNIEYWYCAECEQYWQDEALTQLTNSKNVKIGVADHNTIHFDAVEPGCHYVGNIEYWFCTECEIYWQDAELTQITNSKNVILPAKGGDVIHFAAVEPGCHYVGNIEYWHCPECEQFWQDEALTQVTNSKNVVLPALESTATYVPAKAPTCYEGGNVEYWYCDKCEQVWADEALTQLTNIKNVQLGVAEHNLVNVEAVEPGCHYLGNIEYWYCTECETFWQDEALTQITNSKNVILPAKGGEVIAHEAIEPGCHYDGQIAYWFCPECEQVWQDEALTQLTNLKNVVLPATGSDNLQHVEAKEPTCSEAGNIEYWYCPDCEQYWQDEALTQLTNSKNVIVAPIDHTIVHIEAVEPGCHYIGNIEYWYCSVCEMFWQDEALTQITNSKNVIVPAKGGDVIAHEAIEPGCHYDGQIAYWFCPECEQVWQDEALTQLTNLKNVVLPATGSDKLEHVEAKDPTCLEAGNVEYWYCGECEQVWVDEALTQISNLKNVVIAPVDHTIVHMEAVEPGCHYIGNIEYWYCSVCGTHWQDEALTQITNSKNVIVPAKGGDVVAFEAIEPGCHYDGQIAYWFCAECNQFWADEALTQLTNVKNVVLPATGSDKLVHNEYKAPTATENGHVEHWFCGECNQFWTDEALTQLTNSKNIIIPATGEIVEPDSPVTGDSSVAVVVALLTLIASGVAVVVLKSKKHA